MVILFVIVVLIRPFILFIIRIEQVPNIAGISSAVPSWGNRILVEDRLGIRVVLRGIVVGNVVGIVRRRHISDVGRVDMFSGTSSRRRYVDYSWGGVRVRFRWGIKGWGGLIVLRHLVTLRKPWRPVEVPVSNVDLFTGAEATEAWLA